MTRDTLWLLPTMTAISFAFTTHTADYLFGFGGRAVTFPQDRGARYQYVALRTTQAEGSRYGF